MRINNLLNNTSPLSIGIGFDLEGGGEGGGGTPAPSPAPAPAPTPEPSLMGGPAEGEGDGDAGDGDGDAGTGGDAGADDKGGDDGEGGDGADGDAAAAAKAEEERRAALTDEERAAEDAAKAGAPEAYDFTSVFEGEDAPQLNEETLADFTAILKEDNLTQEQANRYMGIAQKLQQQWLNEVTQHHVNTRAEWRKEAQAHPEFGGEKFAENIALAKQARDAFGSEALGELLDESGLGDHPEVISFFYKVGKANSEHDFVNAGKPAKQQSFYDHPTSKGRKK